MWTPFWIERMSDLARVAVLCALVALVGAAVPTAAAGECANVSLTFCDNVNWAVDAEKRARADNIESMIQMR